MDLLTCVCDAQMRRGRSLEEEQEVRVMKGHRRKLACVKEQGDVLTAVIKERLLLFRCRRMFTSLCESVLQK